ncbi:MAG: hypothetical protein HN754_09965 [Opitutae bacterium]|nr:hypothetical protein [Opitutae bacterium]
MKVITYLFLTVSLLFFFSCGEEQQEEIHSAHNHPAPHGGQLVELGEHGSGFNLELVLHEQGFLQIYVLDAHVQNFVRISANSIDIEITDQNGTARIITCEPIEDPITGETVGNTSLFTSTERINEILPLQGVINKIDIVEFPYENVEINFSGNQQNGLE